MVHGPSSRILDIQRKSQPKPLRNQSATASSPTSIITTTHHLVQPTDYHMDMNGMDTSDANSSTVVMMKPWLHFTGGDILFFNNLAPTSGGAIAAACIVLFAIAVLERGFSAFRAVMEARWRQRALGVMALSFDKLEDSSSEYNVRLPLKTDQQNKSDGVTSNRRRIPPFIPRNDISRGLFQVAQAIMQYTLMLAVMTFQTGYIIAIISGLGVGEAVFARLRLNSELEYGIHVH